MSLQQKTHSCEKECEMVCCRALGLLIFINSLKSSESAYWPAGSYGIPKATSGCPYTDGFQWLIGRRYQDTEDDNPSSHKSSRFHLDATVDSKKGIIRSFCIKTDTSIDVKRGHWPLGKYCIYKKGGSCPTNLTSGFIKWDDEDNDNKNNKTGTLPDGVYDHNTKIEFCCRTDGEKNDPISLPSLKPFFLLAYDSAECQQVKWAVVSVEWIRFDNEDTDNKDGQGGSHPHGAGIDNHKIHYCYYQGCNKTLTGLSGTFHSPNYPQKYPDGQYCSWRITVSSAQQIHLTFTNFSLQNENNTDSLYVYDGENATGEVLGVFYGGHPPPKNGMYSLSNNMLVIFKSDKNVSYTGFIASYTAVNCLACRSMANVTTLTSRTRKLTPSPSIRLSPSSLTSLTSSYSREPTMTSTKTEPAFMTSSFTGPEVTPSYTEPEVTSPYTEPKVTSSYNKAEVTSSYTEPKVTPSYTEREVTPSYTELEVTSSYSEPEVTSSYTEPKVTSFYTEPKVTSSYNKAEVTSSYTEPKVTSSYTEPEETSSYVKPTKTEPSEPTEPLESAEATGARGKPEGVNATAVAVPLVSLVLIAVLLGAGFFYYKRKKTNENDTEPKEFIHMSESALLIENPCYLTSEEANNYFGEVKAPNENKMELKIEKESDNSLA